MQYLIVVGLTLALTSSPSAFGARCYVSSVDQAFANAKSVFVGKVTVVEDPGLPADERLSFKVINLVRPVKVRFAVERIFAGREAKEIDVATQTGGLEFGYDFKVNESYLVYAQEQGTEKSGLVVKGCSRTRPLDEAKEDIRLLEELVRLGIKALHDPL